MVKHANKPRNAICVLYEVLRQKFCCIASHSIRIPQVDGVRLREGVRGIDSDGITSPNKAAALLNSNSFLDGGSGDKDGGLGNGIRLKYVRKQ